MTFKLHRFKVQTGRCLGVASFESSMKASLVSMRCEAKRAKGLSKSSKGKKCRGID